MHTTQFCRIKECGGARQPPNQTFFNVKTNQGKLCIILKRVFGRFRISVNNCELQNFASWSQKSNLGEISQKFKVFLLIKYYKLRINHIRPPAFKILCTHLWTFVFLKTTKAKRKYYKLIKDQSHKTSSIQNFVYTSLNICIFKNNKSKKKGHLNKMLWSQEEDLVTILSLFSTKWMNEFEWMWIS